jgi:hypothetical protein
VGIRWSSPTQLLIHRFEAYVWQSGRDAQFSSIYGRMYHGILYLILYTLKMSYSLKPWQRLSTALRPSQCRARTSRQILGLL